MPRLRRGGAAPGPRRGEARGRLRRRSGPGAGRSRPSDVLDDAVSTLPARASSLTPVLNATGVVVHTNIGRAPLSPAAVQAVADAAGHVDVELDLRTGRAAAAGERGRVAALREAVPEAEAALVVNNGAAALVLATTALASGREVVVSRGEMVEIGDGFRLPDLIASTGARLREVGTTNRTHLADYLDAVGPDTGCILKVHPSNFRVDGFVASVGLDELRDAARPDGSVVPLVADIGSGLLDPRPDAARGAGRHDVACGPARPSSPPAATSCSADRRRASSSAGPRRSSGSGGTRSPGPSASTS